MGARGIPTVDLVDDRAVELVQSRLDVRMLTGQLGHFLPQLVRFRQGLLPDCLTCHAVRVLDDGGTSLGASLGSRLDLVQLQDLFHHDGRVRLHVLELFADDRVPIPFGEPFRFKGEGLASGMQSALCSGPRSPRNGSLQWALVC